MLGSFSPVMLYGARVGHDLVLVFAATRRRLALRAARVIKHAGPPCCFLLKIQFVKPSYTV